VSTLLELVADILLNGLGPSTDRGIIVTSTLIALLLLLIAFAFGTQSPGLYVGAAAVSSVGCLLSILHLRRVPEDRIIALPCLIVHVGAVVIQMRRLMASV
jgi:hypothetical protein